MSFRWKVMFLSLVLAVLFGLYVLGVVFNASAVYGKVVQEPLLSAFEPGKAAEIELSSPTVAPIEIRKEGSNWFVIGNKQKFPASMATVRAFLDSLANLERGKLVNTDPALDSRFELDQSQARRVVVRNSAGKGMADLLVGKPGASGFEDYLMTGGDKRVFLTRSSMTFYLSQSPVYWYDLMLLPDDVTGQTIRSVSVQGRIPVDSNGETQRIEKYTLTEDGTGTQAVWRVKGKSTSIDQTRTQTMCNHLSTLQGVDFSAGQKAEEDSSTSSDLTITVVTEHGSRYLLRAAPIHGGAQYLITRDDHPYIYVVNTAALVRAVVPVERLLSQE